MRKFAAQVGREHGGTVVIDTAINAITGELLVVEFNDLPNSGLYACDVWALYRALVTATDRGYDCCHGIPTDIPDPTEWRNQ